MAAGVTIDQPKATTPTMRPSRPRRGCMASSLPVLNGVAGLAITSEDWRVLYRKRRLSTTVARDPFLLLALHDLPRPWKGGRSFRDTLGRLALIDEYCPHRRVALLRAQRGARAAMRLPRLEVRRRPSGGRIWTRAARPAARADGTLRAPHVPEGSYTDRRVRRSHLQARTRLKGRPTMSHKGFSHIGLSTLDLDRTRDFYENVLKFKAVRCDTLRVKEGGQIRHIFFDTGRDQLIAFMEARGVPGVPAHYDAGINHGLGVPNAFYHFAFEAGSAAGVGENRNAPLAPGGRGTGRGEHAAAQAVYLQGPQPGQVGDAGFPR